MLLTLALALTLTLTLTLILTVLHGPIQSNNSIYGGR